MVLIGDKLKTMLVEIEKEEKTRRDVVMPLHQLFMYDNGLVSGEGLDPIPLGDSALSQICANLRLPTQYMKKLSSQRPDLVASQVNFYLQNTKNLGNKKVRIKNNRIQGFVSERYVPFDNLSFLETVHDATQGIDGLQIKHYNISDRKLHMRLVFENICADFGNDIRGDKDKIFVGFDLENSEIGFRSINLTPVIWRLVCTNGMRKIYSSGEVLKQRHSKFEVAALQERLVTSISNSSEFGIDMLNALHRSRSVKVDDVELTIENFCKSYQISKRQMEVVKENFKHDPEPTMFGIINSFTRTARDFEDNEQRISLENITGEMLAKIS